MMRTDNFYKIFNENLLKAAIIYQDKEITYSDLIKNIAKYRSIILSKGISSGEVVALHGDFTPNCISILFALIENNNIIVPLDYQQIKKNKKKLEIACVSKSISVDNEDQVFFTDLEHKKVNVFYEKLQLINRPGLVLFTSGTSGEPKAAIHDLVKLLEKFKIRTTSLRTLNFLLFDHWGGLNTMFHTLSNGGVVLALNDRRPQSICSFIEKHKIELLPASPTFLNLMIISEEYQKYNLESLRLITYGTEPMPQYTLEKVKKIFPNIKLKQTYGLIELGVLRSKSKSDDSLWVKVGGEGFETRVVNELLEIKAESAMMGYLNAPSPFTKDGWFMTGDQVEVDGEYFKILGRKSEIINVGGEKVYPAEIESVILELENILDVTVYGEKNPIMGQIVCAKVTFKSNIDSKYEINQIKAYCRNKLERFKVPVKIKIEDGILHNERFKKKRNI